MEAKYFMVGDWVLDDEGTPFRVAQVNDSCFGEHSSGLMLEDGDIYTDVRPIPLTKEILEKYGLTEPEAFNGYWLMENKDGSYSIEDHCLIKMRYVHELQRTLKMCDIQKEIILR